VGGYSLSAWAGESGWNRCSEIQIGDDCTHSVDAALAAKGCGTLYDVQTDDDDMVCVEVCAITKGSVFSGLLFRTFGSTIPSRQGHEATRNSQSTQRAVERRQAISTSKP